MSTISTINNNNVNNVNLQPPTGPKNGQPRANLPPELQNARPSGRSILARVASFLLGAGAAGSASAFLGGGTLLSGAIGTTATAFLGATAVAGIATGGAALIGGAIGLGIFAGIRAIVNHFRRAPAPPPRVQNNPALPQARPAADAYNNNTVAAAIRSGKALPASLQQAAGTAILRMREIYGEALVPQDATLSQLLGGRKNSLATEIGKLGDAVTPQQMERLVETQMRQSMSSAAMDTALKPLCGQDAFQTAEMRKIVATKNPNLVNALTNAASHEEVQDILANVTDKVQQMKNETVDQIQNADIPDKLKARWIEKARNGAISGEAVLQSLIKNVPNLPAETQPIMERAILLRSFAPDKAENSAQEARSLAQELSSWQNFSSAGDQSMAPVNNWLFNNITGALYKGQTFDNNGISNQMKLDAHRGTYTINGKVLAHKQADEVADAIKNAMPTTEAAKMVSAIVNQRSFSPLQALGMQIDPRTLSPLPPEVTGALGKMASRDFLSTGGSILHIDLAPSQRADVCYKVTIQDGKAHIETSELVGLDAGLGTGENGFPRLGGAARFTLHFECDLLGKNGHSPSITGITLQQELLPDEAAPRHPSVQA